MINKSDSIVYPVFNS